MHILQTLGNCVQEIGLSHGLAASLFIAGIVGSLSHCVTMCGPFVISQVGHMEKMSNSILLPYHFGRIVTYSTLAVLLSSVLNVVFLYLPIRSYIVAPILMISGLVFLMNAFPKFAVTFKNIFPWAISVHIHTPIHAIRNMFQKLETLKSLPFKQFSMGILLGFMPCGLATAALMASATAPSAIDAGIAMTAFGIGTMPTLITTAFVGNSLQRKYPRVMPRITQAMMVWSGLWLFIMAGIILI